MKSKKFVKTAGIALSVIGLKINVVSGMLDDKKLDIKIAEEVSKHLNKK